MSDLSAQFSHFAGRTVGVTEQKKNIKFLDSVIPHTSVTVNQNDPAVAELNAAAKAAGYQLRLWTPGMMGTMDYRPNRLNAHVEKNDAGVYALSARFHIG